MLRFTVDMCMPKPNCIMCTEAKDTEAPYPKHIDQQTRLGELTHIDLWGKYDVQSINRHQYYALFADDASRYMTLHFLKGKHEAVQVVKDYYAHLDAWMHGKSYVDRQGEGICQ